LALRPDQVTAAFARPGVAQHLQRTQIVSPADLLVRLRLGRQGLDRFAAGATVHTDDNGLIEFGAPRDLFTETNPDTHRRFLALQTFPPEGAAGWVWDAALHEAAARAALRMGWLELAVRYAVAAQADALRPDALWVVAEASRRRGDPREARDLLLQALALSPGHPEVRLALAQHAGEQGDLSAALAHAQVALRARPGWPEALRVLGVTHFNHQDFPAAVRSFRQAAAHPAVATM
jgi:tetratricopeptide (TPR) repeat protein